MRDNRKGKYESAPDARAPDPSAASVTPAAVIHSVDTVKDVAPASKPGVAGTLGYNYYDREYLEPNEYLPQVMMRCIIMNPYGWSVFDDGSFSPAPVPTKVDGPSKIWELWSTAPQLLLDRILKRDSVRFLPDSFDNAHILEPKEAFAASLISNTRMLRTLIDCESWNDGTKYLRSSFARKNRRCAELEAQLSTEELAPLWTSLGLSEPVLAPYPGGPLLITWCDLSWLASFFGSEKDSSHLCFKDRMVDTANIDDWVKTSGAIDDALCELENGVRLLRAQDDLVAMDGNVAGGFTWLTGSGRGYRADMKYMRIMYTELRYPAIGPISGDVLVNFGAFNQKLYGEALYGVDLTDATPDVRHLVGYPLIESGDTYVYRRGKALLTREIETGMYDEWAVVEGSTDQEFDTVLGFKVQVGQGSNDVMYPSKFTVALMDRYGTWSVPAGEVNFDDADSLRVFFELYVVSDHQWNEALFQRQDSFNQIRDIQPASYSLHQGTAVPFEGIRALLATTYDIPFQR